MTEGTFSSEVVRPAPKVEVKQSSDSTTKVVLKENLGKVTDEVSQVKLHTHKGKQLLEGLDTTEGSGSTAHKTLQELAKGTLTRVTKMDRFIYAEVLRAGGDIDQAMQSLQEGIASGRLYNIAENAIDNPQRLERVCKAAGVDYQSVQQRSGEYRRLLGEEQLTPDQAIALEILAFRDILATQLQNRDYVTEAYTQMHGRMTNTQTQERYQELTGKELTIDNVIGGPNNVEKAKKETENTVKSLSNDLEQVYKDLPIGEQVPFADVAKYTDQDLSQVVLDSTQTTDRSTTIQNQLATLQTFRDRGRSLLTNARGVSHEAYTQLVEQQVALLKLVGAHNLALQKLQEDSQADMSLAA